MNKNISCLKPSVKNSLPWHDIRLLYVLPPQSGHDCASQVKGVATSGRERRSKQEPQYSRPSTAAGKMGETEEEKDSGGKLFESFIQASTCKGTLQAFNVLCRCLDLDPADHSTFYSSLKAKLTSWKAKALWSKLDKRMTHKEYKKGQACVDTKVRLIISLHWLSLTLLKNTSRETYKDRSDTYSVQIHVYSVYF